MRKISKFNGFTLIELMVTVAILAIITAVAVPTYQAQVQKSRRADATSTLMGEAQAQERCFTDVNTFVGCRDYDPALSSPHGYYTISGAVTSVTYTITATATGNQTADTLCRSFTINHLGAKSAQDSEGNDSSSDCWK
jgi:type IV pilus assembly protein PilE